MVWKCWLSDIFIAIIAGILRSYIWDLTEISKFSKNSHGLTLGFLWNFYRGRYLHHDSGSQQMVTWWSYLKRFGSFIKIINICPQNVCQFMPETRKACRDLTTKIFLNLILLLSSRTWCFLLWACPTPATRTIFFSKFNISYK